MGPTAMPLHTQEVPFIGPSTSKFPRLCKHPVGELVVQLVTSSFSCSLAPALFPPVYVHALVFIRRDPCGSLAVE